MSKLNQNIVLFIEKAKKVFYTPSKIGNLFMNRFAIDEDAQSEILKIYQLERPLYHWVKEEKLFYGRLTLKEGLDPKNYRIAYDS